MATKKEQTTTTKAEEPAVLQEADVGMAQPKLKEYKSEELLKVFDELIFQGEYTEEQTIRGKLKVTFRSRSAEETMEISKTLDNMDFKLLSTMQEQRAFLNLAKSLTLYQGRDLEKLKADEKIQFIKRLPTSILGALADALAEFDRKVDLACREADANF